MGRSLKVVSGGGTIMLDGSTGITARLAVSGTGMAPVQNQWFEGAGDGKSYRGGRVLARRMNVPFKVEADRLDPFNREVVRQRYANLARVLSVRNAPARLTIDLDTSTPGGDRWWLDVVRSGGGDWDWDKDTDGSSFILSDFSFDVGDPYWTSEDQESKVISPEGVGLGLLGTGISLAQLRVGSVDGYGSTTILNTGEADAYPVWTIKAPFTGFSLVSQTGESLLWALDSGTKDTGYIVVNTKDGTVVDETGANRYAELDPSPQFWAVAPGPNNVGVVMAGASAETETTVVWNRRREVVF